MKKKIISVGIVLILLLLCAVGAWIAGQIQARKNAEQEIIALKTELEELLNTPVVVTPVTPEINLCLVYSEIQNIGELATVEYLFTDAAKFTDSKQVSKWNIPLTEKSFLIKWDGVIKAGIDLDKVTIDVDVEDNKLVVTMPKAEILSYSVDNESVEVLDEKDNIFNKLTIEDKVKFDEETETAMKNRAIENGILEKAEKNAENVLARLLLANPAIGTTYTIEFITVDSNS